MIVQPARIEDAEEICQLVNSAYRGESSRFGWTTEADYLDGGRISPETTGNMIRPEEGKAILILRERPNESPILGCVYLERFIEDDEIACYLGMLTVNPKMQDKGLGRLLLAEGEKYALHSWRAKKITLGVIYLRGTLIAWYERRGYKQTNVIKPFPYDQPENGIPKRPDLHFIMLEKVLS